ncbi:Hypothetical protein, putative [Bodo saltans]|uniref:Uncharacterized protein n=1 Tax=Bodo saltans TaxID=75058 RepID=A0A0S4ISP6_BODSA|nr:Hypothetical protein, putative [Bodo saltans]|eukprot:CUG06152.1 Hypothetical protein, putative [Bodo saltans]
MPLGVLAVDIDKLIQNRITIPSSSARNFAADTKTSPFSKDRNHHHRHHTSPASSHNERSGHQQRSISPRGIEAYPSTPHRRNDCYLIKGDDGTRVWNGVVVPPASPTLTPTTTPRGKHRRRMGPRSGGISPRSSDNGTPFQIEDVATGPSSTLDEVPFAVEVHWSPREAHSTVTIVPSPSRQFLRNASEERHHHGGSSAITPRSFSGARGFSQPSATPPPLHTMHNPATVSNNIGKVEPPPLPTAAGTGIMVAPRPGSGSSLEGGGGQSRKGSATATRQGSARTVRVIDHNEEPLSHSSEDLRAARPPLGGKTTTQQEGDDDTTLSNEPSSSSRISAVAQDIIDTTLSYVKGRVQIIMNPPPRIPQPPSTFPSRDVEERLLGPKRRGCDEDGVVSSRRRVSHGDMIASGDASCSTHRQRDMIREKERRLANVSFRHENIFEPHCRSLPSTLSTYRLSLHAKKDPMFPAVFDLEYVKPSRVVHAHKNTAERRSQAYDTISPSEQKILDVIAAKGTV